ncbi:MAG: hypothetical protein ACD_37C00426G0001 [uncultured bacterium]|uniref:Regulatory protein RecX n=1 Tax=Candidatus Woesebacteria bacterium RIFCSPLOWO2_01_FULL_39_21 TaxID=1802519 RepID=A0A1F8BFB7_9BACT|nr:MAG: hypothetical protein ACD_37C00426G0001 [uncultured bacterium]OGM22053.1 MAG: hypothetical protein A2691_03130 [Candidatus Woesebacteria bacterium RIFCSPHIGHO2_01_FULL_39_23]OGM62055.1 MAG: hypothetical protein A2961_04755 [Candidatus Woesebacteria bacterium RIFCSPLOWO2_01_FULL_39_21]
MNKQTEYQNIFDKVIKFATLRPRSIKEIERYFNRKKTVKGVQKQLFNKLKSLGLVDDKEFARWWVDQRLTFRPKGERLLRNELRIKGISEDIISTVFEEKNVINEQKKIATNIMSKKVNQYNNLPMNKARKRAYSLLLRRGFDWDIAREVIDEFLDKK